MNPTTIRLSDQAHKRLDQLCQFHRMSQSDLFRMLLEMEWQRVGGQAKRIAEFAATVRQEVDGG